MSYVVYARKYRPAVFDEVIGQKPVVQTLENAVKSDRIANGYIFSGMRGVGKTTAARILAKALNCSEGPTPVPCNRCEACRDIQEGRSVDVLEIDGASNRGIDEVRALREGVRYKPLQGRYKIIIIDEVHMLTMEAFNALLKTLEEPPERAIFILATTEFHKVPATIVSRCQHFEFRKIPAKEIASHLGFIAEKEGISISKPGLNIIAEAAEGSLRDAQSLLDQTVAFSGENIQEEDIRELLGTVNQKLLFEFSSAVMDNHPDKIFTLVEKVMERGHDLRFFYMELIRHFRSLLIAATVEDSADILLIPEQEAAQVKEEAGKASPEQILRYLHTLQEGEQGLKYSSHPRFYFETLLVRLCTLRHLIPVQEILKEIQKIKSGGRPEFSPVPASDGVSGKAPEKNEKRTDYPAPSGNKTGDPITGVREEKKENPALKDPRVRDFLSEFKAQILSVGKKDQS
ncbi:MAG: DNA polymerase III subunit gamma/tau [Candidatus Aminicenantaceae bacterium]